MKLHIFFIAIFFSVSLMCADPMSSDITHGATEEKVDAYNSIKQLEHLPRETLITWELKPRHRLTKGDIVALVKNKILVVGCEWTSGVIKLKDGNHIALLWADEIDGQQVAKDLSNGDVQELEYFYLSPT